MTPTTEDSATQTDSTGAPLSEHGHAGLGDGRWIVVTLMGHLDAKWMEWLGAKDMSLESNGTTRLRIFIADQPMLYGALMRIRDLGMTLISLVPEDHP